MTQQHEDISEIVKQWLHIAKRNLVLAKKIMEKEISAEADSLTDYAAEIRYPDDWYEPTIEETQKAFSVALKIKKLVLEKLPKNITEN